MDGGDTPAASPEPAAVLDSASRLQELVPNAVLAGESAAAHYAGHRDSFESEGEWVTNRVRPGKLTLGRLGDIEAGVRQLIRTRPLEVTTVRLPSGRTLQVPTFDETLRVKGFLVVRRNQTRDFLDVAALSIPGRTTRRSPDSSTPTATSTPAGTTGARSVPCAVPSRARCSTGRDER